MTLPTNDPELRRLLQDVEDAKVTVANYEAILKEERDNLANAKAAVNDYHRKRKRELEKGRLERERIL